MMPTWLQGWLRARGWGGLSPYHNGHHHPEPRPAHGPQPHDYARLQRLEATVSSITAARQRFDRELADFERETNGGRGGGQ